jgi:hypothetical protein
METVFQDFTSNKYPVPIQTTGISLFWRGMCDSDSILTQCVLYIAKDATHVLEEFCCSHQDIAAHLGKQFLFKILLKQTSGTNTTTWISLVLWVCVTVDLQRTQCFNHCRTRHVLRRFCSHRNQDIAVYLTVKLFSKILISSNNQTNVYAITVSSAYVTVIHPHNKFIHCKGRVTRAWRSCLIVTKILQSILVKLFFKILISNKYPVPHNDRDLLYLWKCDSRFTHTIFYSLQRTRHTCLKSLFHSHQDIAVHLSETVFEDYNFKQISKLIQRQGFAFYFFLGYVW